LAAGASFDVGGTRPLDLISGAGEVLLGLADRGDLGVDRVCHRRRVGFGGAHEKQPGAVLSSELEGGHQRRLGQGRAVQWNQDLGDVHRLFPPDAGR
jgi:hypothetical protein